MNIIFREYKEVDYQTLLDLTDRLASFAKSIDPIKRVQNLSGFAETDLKDTLSDLTNNEGKILFAEVNGKAIGYIIGIIWKQQPEKVRLEIGPHKTGEVMDLYVDEEFRSKGVGKELLTMIENYFKENKCDGMWIQVFEPNVNAHNFYKKHGFIDRDVGMLKQI